MSVKQVKVCDVCNNDIDWDGMLPDATPDEWRLILITIKDSDGMSDEDIRLEVCPKHAGIDLATILKRALP